ncbi:phospholipase D-like domain-containing protein [Rhodocytophaga aerolata]|uniref:phospholipase D n=1 Tax=Rhodocytophaga aerolata TaxID=455078 RepID=A0ABT8R6A2_9BACT|nr:phospholipase D-like domain-containing protein [Rhodocytophaga aerolata]MDO1447635.1 phospholipase D-like domain-containing protein [Rhodocytophaga aerolata]
MEKLEQAFFQSFSDKLISRQEKQALKEILQAEKPDEHKKAWLRSRIFDWVHNELKDATSQQLLAWLEEANKLLAAAVHPATEEQVYFSPGEQCLQAIITHLQQAIDTIDICVFTISDDRIASQILSCYHAGKRMRIITDNEKLHDMGSDIKQLAQAGIPIMVDRTRDHMHHKFAILDSQIVLTGSYNWTRSAASHNHENILVTNHPGVVQQFEQEFNKLWKQLEVF